MTWCVLGSGGALAGPRTQEESGWDALRRGDYEQALEALTQDARLYQYSPIPLDGIGWCHYYLGDVPEAQKWFEKALEKDEAYKWSLKGLEAVETWRWAVIEQARKYYWAGEYENSATWYRLVIAEPNRLPEGERWRGHAGLALSLSLGGDAKASLEPFLTSLKIAPRELVILRGLGHAYHALGNWTQAEKYLERALKQGDDLLDTRRLLAWNHYRRGSTRKAMAAFEQLVAEYPEDGSAWYGMGMCSLAQPPTRGRVVANMAAFDKAAALEPSVFEADWLSVARASSDWIPLRLAHAWSLIHHGYATAAEARFAELIDEGVELQAARLGRAHALFSLGDAAGAETVLAGDTGDELAVVEVNTGGAPLLLKSNASSLGAWCALRLGRYAEAETAFRAVVRVHRDWFDSLCGLGWTLLALDRGEDADASFQRALEIAPDYSDAVAGMTAVARWRIAAYEAARTSYYAGDSAGAIRALEAILDDHGRFPEASLHLVHDLLGWSHLALGDTDSARESFDKALKAERTFFTSLKGLALCHLVDENYAKALAVCLRTLKSYAGAADILSLKGWCLLRTGMELDAVEAFNQAVDRAVEQGETLGDAYRGRAWAWVKLNAAADARADFAVAASSIPLTLDDEDFRELVERDETYASLSGDLAWGLLYNGAYDRALEWFEIARALIPEGAEYARGEGLAHYSLGHWEEAIDTLEDLAKSAPRRELGWGSWSSVYSALGWSQLYAGENRAALSTFGDLKALHRSDDFWPDPHNGLGWTNIALKSPSRARRAFQDALRCSPTYASALQGLAQLDQDDSQ